jgi:hypothetical protein
VHELLNSVEAATDEQRELADGTASSVEAYHEGRFEACIARWEALGERFGRTKLVELYIATCRTYLEQGAPDDFAGALVLSEK